MPRRSESTDNVLVAVITLVTLLGTTLAGCNGTRVDSSWRACAIVVDGRADEWPGQYVYAFDKENFRFGVANDSTSLYVLLRTTDLRLAFQALGQGLQVRFRPANGHGILWIGSPYSFALGRGVPRREAQDRGGYRGSRSMISEEVLDRIRRGIDDLPEEVQIFTASGEDSLILSFAEGARRGIEVKEGCDRDGRFIIEMKVPLQRDIDHPQAIGMSLGPLDPVLEIQLRIPRPDPNAPGFRGNHGDGTSMRSGLRTGFGGTLAQSVLTPRRQGDLFPESQSGRGRGGPPEGLDVTFQVRLSRQPATAP
jgi:hypothetical protein